jgi:hypothetical protein
MRVARASHPHFHGAHRRPPSPNPVPTLDAAPADHRWQWHAFLSGASAALYVFLYAVYYFLFRTECVDDRTERSDGFGPT